MSPDRLRAIAEQVRNVAAEFRAEASTEDKPSRQSYLLSEAERYDERADFYDNDADQREYRMSIHAPKQEIAA